MLISNKFYLRKFYVRHKKLLLSWVICVQVERLSKVCIILIDVCDWDSKVVNSIKYYANLIHSYYKTTYNSELIVVHLKKLIKKYSLLFFKLSFIENLMFFFKIYINNK